MLPVNRPFKAASRLLSSLLLVMPVAAANGGAAPEPELHVVTISKMAFGPVPARVRSGDVILWVNNDMFKHTATARDRSFDVDLPPGAKGRTVVGRAGSVAFYCRYHPGMTGTLVVVK